MSRSNYDKPFYVDVGTSIVAVRCASNHDIVLRYDHSWRPSSIELVKTACDRMNREAEIGRPRRNCDVGTAEEQMKRQYDTMCNTTKACPDSDWSCKKCFAEWEQMPYESEVEK